MIQSEKSQSSTFFYGWYIMAASFGILFFNSGARFSFGVIFDYMGSYQLVFVLAAIMAMVAVFSSMAIAEKRDEQDSDKIAACLHGYPRSSKRR